MPLLDARPLARSILAWYRRHSRDLPWRGTRDPYRVWVSEVMLQQTTVRAVIPYYRRFLRRFPSLRALAEAPPRAVLAAWSGLGYYRRARHLHAAARLIVARHEGRFPRDPEAVRGLPGVGRYTAGAILSIAFGRREPVLDGNVSRLLSRLVLLRGDPRAAAHQKTLWALARALVETTSSPGDLNQALMELGAIVCVPLAPRCGVCPLERRCAARSAGAQERVPPPRSARAPITVRSSVALVRRDGRYLMRRREGTDLMDGLWEFPALGEDRIRPAAGRAGRYAPRRGASRRAGPARAGLRLRPLERIATLRHSITFRRLVVEVRRARLLSEPRGGAYRWVTPAQALKLPASSLVAKVFASLPRSGGRGV